MRMNHATIAALTYAFSRRAHNTHDTQNTRRPHTSVYTSVSYAVQYDFLRPHIHERDGEVFIFRAPERFPIWINQSLHNQDIDSCDAAYPPKGLTNRSLFSFFSPPHPQPLGPIGMAWYVINDIFISHRFHLVQHVYYHHIYHRHFHPSQEREREIPEEEYSVQLIRLGGQTCEKDTPFGCFSSFSRLFGVGSHMEGGFLSHTESTLLVSPPVLVLVVVQQRFLYFFVLGISVMVREFQKERRHMMMTIHQPTLLELYGHHMRPRLSTYTLVS